MREPQHFRFARASGPEPLPGAALLAKKSTATSPRYNYFFPS
jgi:hypothetical protein